MGGAMKKLIFTATLFIAIIFIPFLAFPDGNKSEVTGIKSELTNTSAIPNDVFEKFQFNVEDNEEYSGHTEMDFRICG